MGKPPYELPEFIHVPDGPYAGVWIRPAAFTRKQQRTLMEIATGYLWSRTPPGLPLPRMKVATDEEYNFVLGLCVVGHAKRIYPLSYEGQHG